jgi:flagellar motor switch protein FliG
MALTGREKATIFLSILGAETSARVLRYLPDELADLIASGINHLPSPSPDALEEVLSEFNSFAALPESKAASVPQIEERPVPAKPKKSYNPLMYERPQMVAFLISLLPEEERDDALNSLPREKAIIQELLAGLKATPLSAKLEERLKEQYKGKIFS